jgi:hypothetical protein
MEEIKMKSTGKEVSVMYRGGRPYLILRETTSKDFFLEVKQPSQELIERLEEYNEKHDVL